MSDPRHAPESGSVTVPREPTDEMLVQGLDAFCGEARRQNYEHDLPAKEFGRGLAVGRTLHSCREVRAAWAAMLAAAPKDAAPAPSAPQHDALRARVEAMVIKLDFMSSCQRSATGEHNTSSFLMESAARLFRDLLATPPQADQGGDPMRGAGDRANNRYRKKSVVIEAVQWDGEAGWVRPDMPSWFREAIYVPQGEPGRIQADGRDLIISTLDGDCRASHGDWIIRDVKGQVHPYKPDIFVELYEPAQSRNPTPASDAPAPAGEDLAGQFASWTTDDLAKQCLMQAREMLDPELSRFFVAVAARLRPAPSAPSAGREAMVSKVRSVLIYRGLDADADEEDVAYIADAILALTAPSPGDERGETAWQAIETAPKDGTKFDAWAVHPVTGSMGLRFPDVHMRGDDTGFGVVIHTPKAQWEYLEQDGPTYPAWRLTHWRTRPDAPTPPAAATEATGERS